MEFLEKGGWAVDRVPEKNFVTDGRGGVIFGGGDATVEGGEDGFVVVFVVVVVMMVMVVGGIECLRASMGNVFPLKKDIACLAEGAESAQPALEDATEGCNSGGDLYTVEDRAGGGDGIEGIA